MEISRWKTVLFEWVKKTQLVNVTGTLEHIDIKQFFEEFHLKTDPHSKYDLVTFLKENFPSFEVLYDEDHNISSQDSMYVFSLFLYYSCVLKNNDFFQNCCKILSLQQGSALYKFFASIKQAYERKEPITKEVLRLGIKDTILSPISMPNFMCSSPVRTPDKAIQTPSRNIHIDRSKELQRTKTMLESERYERTIVEAELKQSEITVQSLIKEQKSLKHELYRLKTEQMLDRDQENFSPNKAVRDEQIRAKMQKEIDAREETIVNLRCEIEALTSQHERASNRINMMDNEMKGLRHKVDDLDSVIEELMNESHFKDNRIQALEETNNDLQSFINETRKNSTQHKDSSSDCLDFSYSTINTVGNSSDSGEPGENLAKCVIDVQLREKELENQKLQDLLEAVNSEKENLDEALIAHSETITALQKEIKEQTQHTTKLTTDIQKLIAQLDDAKKGNDGLQSAVTASQETIKVMQSELQSQANKIGDELKATQAARDEFLKMLEDEKINFANLRLKYETENSSLTKVIEELLVEIDLKTAELQATADKIAALKADHKLDVEVALNKKKKDLEVLMAAKDVELTKMHDDLQAKFENSEKKRKAMEKSYQSKSQHINLRIVDLETKIDGQEKTIENLKTLVEKIEQEKSNLMKEITEKDHQIAEIGRDSKTKFIELSDNFVTLQRELEVTTSNSEEILVKLQSKEDIISSLKIEIKQLTGVTAARDEEIVRVEAEKAVLEKEMTNKSAEIVEEKAKLAELSRSKAKLQEDLNNELEHFRAQLESANQEMSSKEISIADHKKRIQSLDEENKEVAEKHQKALEVVNDLSKQLEEKTLALQDVTASITTLYKDLESTKEALETLNAEHKENIEKAFEQSESLRVQVSELETQVKTADSNKLNLEAEKEEIAAKFVEMSSANEELQSALTATKTEVLKLAEDLVAAKSSLEQFERAKAQLESQLTQITKQHEQSSIEEGQLKEEIENLKKAIVQSNKEQESQLQLTVAQLKDNISSITAGNEALTEKVVELETTKNNLTASLKEKEELLQTLADREADAEKKTAEWKFVSESLKRDAEQQLSEISSLKQNIEEKEIQIGNIELEMSVLSEREKSANRMKAIVEKELEEAKNSIAAKNSEIEKLKEQVQVKQAKISSADKLIETLRAEVKDLNVRMDKEREESLALQKKIQEGDAMVTGVYLNIDELKDEKMKLQESLKKVEEEKLALHSSIGEINEKLDNTKNEISQKNSRLADLEAQLAVMKETIRNNAQMKVNYEILDTEINIFKERADTLEVTVSAKEEEIAKLRNESDAHLKVIDDLNNTTNQKTSELQDQIRECHEKFQQQMSELEVMQSNVDKLERERQELNKKVEATQEAAEAERKVAEVKLQAAESQVQVLESMERASEEQREILEASMTTVYEELVAAKLQLESAETQIKAAEISRVEIEMNAKAAENKLRTADMKLQEVESQIKSTEAQRLAIETELAETKAQIEVSVTLRSKLEEKHSVAISELKSSIKNLEDATADKESTIITMVSEIDHLKITYREQINSLEHQLKAKSTGFDNTRVVELLEKLREFKDIKEKMVELENEHLREKAYNDKISNDNKVLSAKLMKEREERNMLAKTVEEAKKKREAEFHEMKRKCDEEVKETRLEMEGKLEKMKDKMKDLYNEEMSKKKQNYEEKLSEQRDDILQMHGKIGHLEGQTSKLQKDKDHLQGEVSFLQSKLMFLEKNGSTQSTGSIGMSRPSTMSQMNAGNFGMEDEAGEMFNNTYLTDLKTGGSLTSLDTNNAYSAAELQKRNSMYPISMRGSYAMINTDVNLGEHEMRDGCPLDNSQVALLQHGNRKKQSTTYKRPGPPTPSKLAGRLSIGGGGSEINYNHILKDSKNNENISKNTPSRLKAFFMGKNNTENAKPSPRRLSIFGKK